MQVFKACTVATHIERIEIVNLDMLAPVIPLAGPELRIRLALKDIAGPYKSLAQTKLIVANPVVEVGVAGGIGGVRLEHNFGVKPGLVGIVVGVQPVVDKNEFAISFGFVSQPVLGPCARRLESDLLAALAVQSIAGTEISMKLERA